MLIDNFTANCPYCGESFQTTVDLSTLDSNANELDYIEDCQVCCRPIIFRVRFEMDSEQAFSVQLRRDDE